MSSTSEMRRIAIDNNAHPTTHPVWLFAAIGIWLLILALAMWRYHGPQLVTATELQNPLMYSGANAEKILFELVGNGVPHPAGSKDNIRVRELIMDMVRGLGFDVYQQKTDSHIHSDLANPKVELTNILFRLEGTNSNDSPAVMLVAHHDSSRNGPGAGDDGVGVAAVLEIARMLKSQPAPRNDVIFLITDGEEYGLLGAARFCEEHSWAKQVRVCINLEARGTSGPSLMFQSSEDNLWLVKLMAGHLNRPYTSSLFFEIYRRLPNDTDFTVFKKFGIAGYNFAFIGDIRNYHTPNDSFENVSRASLQHHGGNALQLLTALADYDLNSIGGGNAVYFDVFGCFVVWWPDWMTLPWSVGLLIVMLMAIRSGATDSVPTNRRLQIERIIAAFLLILITVAAVVGIVTMIGRRLAVDGDFKSPWPEAPFSLLMAYWTSALVALIVLIRVVQIRIRLADWTHAIGLVWIVIAVLLAVFLPGASYLFLVPATVMIFGVILLRFLPSAQAPFIFLLVWTIAVGVVWIPMQPLFYDALGFRFSIVVAILASIVTSTLLPYIGTMSNRSSWHTAATTGFAAATFAIIAIVQNRAA